jgi:cell division protein FtsL
MKVMEEQRETKGYGRQHQVQSGRSVLQELAQQQGNRQKSIYQHDNSYENSRQPGTYYTGNQQAGYNQPGNQQEARKSQGADANGEHQRSRQPKDAGKKSRKSFFSGLISGTLISESLILKDMKYSALIAVLAIIFISNKFSAERVERQIIVLEQEVRDMRAESLSVSAELGSVSRQSEITDLVKERGLGLEELREPPYRIVVSE